MALNVCSVWIGATTATTARVKARLTVAGSGTLLVADNEAMSGPVVIGPVASGGDNVLTFDVTDLEAGAQYWVLVDDGALNVSFKATFRTHPGAVGEPLSYIFGAAGDAGLTGDGDDSYITSAVSNNPVFDTMRAQAAAEQWSWFSHLGDLHYRNIATNSPASFRTAYFENMNYGPVVGPFRQGDFFRSVASTYVWDDHDFGPNNSDRTSASRPAAQQVYREWVPHYPLPDPAGIYQSWQVGRVLYIASDVRSFRDPNSDPLTPSKTMLGTAQKAWMETLLTTTSAKALVWQCPSRWVGGDDTWNSFPHERAEMIQFLGDTGWLDRMVFMTADMHATSICSGPNNPHGSFPMFMFASLDAGAWSTGPEYDIGSVAGRRQYGTLRVTDNGHTIALTGTGYQDGSVLMSHTAYLHVGTPVLALNYAAGHISAPFEPTKDDQGLRNEVTAKREGGGEYTYALTEGARSVQDPPHGAGLYDDSISLEVANDDQLPDQAAWRVHLGTVPQARYPTVHVDLAANPDLADDVTSLYLGDRATISTPPPWLPPDPIQLIAEGGTETYALERWSMEVTASPGSAWTVAQLPPGDASTAGPDRPNRLDTSGSHLLADVTSTATELLVHTPQDALQGHAPWINSEGLTGVHPTHFPLDLRLGGEVVRAVLIKPLGYDTFTRTVAAGSWGTSTGGQAWTLAGGTASERSVNGSRGLVAMPSSPSSVRFQVLPTAVGDCEIRARLSLDQLAAGASIVPGILLRYVDTANFYRARLHFHTTSGQLFASVTRDTTQVGGTPQIPYTYTAGAEFELRVRLIGQRVLMRVWPVGIPEPARWHHDVTITTNPIAAGQVGTTVSAFAGNTNVNPVVSVDNFEVITPQRITVTRSINTVTKAQTAGTAIALAQPAIVAL
ncbi:hypothetical protein DMA15_17665 [Streptomyces sp. WAC 01529]|uniref:alkaline phosphatase D family protein n=1 Tax=Streptomyces sp. WAC 01529 TaxID=2203205 RepID=UPI000F70180A|nr:alkaline phosphatase D family protein [Streptomyces sp. WAC 01529]AZM54172.1 hypothetical protein DMA15_17665 [Streptomyces sp. WAC 01529]